MSFRFAAGAVTLALTLPLSIQPAFAAFNETDYSQNPACGVGYEDNFKQFTDQIPGSFYGWRATAQHNFNPCRTLSYVVAEAITKDPNTPRHIMFFRKGAYFGTVTPEAHAFTEVVGATDTSVTVNYYHWKAPGWPEQFAGQVTYRWDGEKVVADGQIQPAPAPNAPQFSLPALSSGLW